MGAAKRSVVIGGDQRRDANDVRARGAGIHMRTHRIVAAVRPASSLHHRKRFVFLWAIGHERAPRRAASFFRARKRRIFTLPLFTPTIWAISVWDEPSA